MTLDRARHTRGRSALAVLVAGLLVGLLLAGCGGEGSDDGSGAVSQAVQKCRSQWRKLADAYTEKGDSRRPSDLASRWTALASGAYYQATGSGSSDCADSIAQTEKRAAAIAALSRKLVRFDLVAAEERIVPAVTKTMAAKPRAAKGARINKALQQLQISAGEAATDMRGGWNAANSIDLDNTAQVAKVVRDLSFLAGDSAPYAQGQAALRQLRQLT